MLLEPTSGFVMACVIPTGKESTASSLRASRFPSVYLITGNGLSAAGAAIRMHDHGALIWSLNKNVHRRLRFCIPFVCALEDDAGDGGCLLRSSDRLEILVKDLIGGGRLRRLPSNLDFIGVDRGRLAVLLRQARRDLGGALDIAMAGVAGHSGRPPEI